MEKRVPDFTSKGNSNVPRTGLEHGAVVEFLLCFMGQWSKSVKKQMEMKKRNTPKVYILYQRNGPAIGFFEVPWTTYYFRAVI